MMHPTRPWPGVLAYFALTALLTLPFWLAGALFAANPLPGLSLSALAVIVPIISACLVTAWIGGLKSVATLFSGLRRSRGNVLATAIIAVAAPLLAALASWYFAKPADLAFVPLTDLLLLAPIFLIAAIAEEVGWSAFATGRLAPYTGPILAALVIGAAWALWHIPSLIELGRAPDWIAWWSLWTIAQRVIMVTLFIAGGGWLWSAVLMHATTNLVWQAAPNAFDPMAEALVTVALALALVLWHRTRSRQFAGGTSPGVKKNM